MVLLLIGLLSRCAESKLHKVHALFRMQKEHLWQAENTTTGTGMSLHQGRGCTSKMLHNINEIMLSIPWKENPHLALKISNNWMQSLGERQEKSEHWKERKCDRDKTTHYWGKKCFWTVVQYTTFAYNAKTEQESGLKAAAFWLIRCILEALLTCALHKELYELPGLNSSWRARISIRLIKNIKSFRIMKNPLEIFHWANGISPPDFKRSSGLFSL